MQSFVSFRGSYTLPTYIYRCLIVCAMYFNLLLKL